MAEDPEKIARRVALDEVKRHRGDPVPHPRLFGEFGKKLAECKNRDEARVLLGLPPLGVS
jgi:hypothetical protein